ncbi:hypothetical protein Clacol_003617 [Clathrus columnatus]|uniref:Uncharacterized protein n=1 Tax=Clathrus columnatus TaxID=1419009 RepID=A0AAV5A8W1_9AGAM|nr:hypothetical protein Clacol_003617 [Clathrus columnatus]
MTISVAQRRAIEEVTEKLCSVTKGRRKLCEMFMELPDRETWPEYYKVIPEPRCLEGIRVDVEKGKYKDALAVYEDLLLVFANALHYNEQESQIAKDAVILKSTLQETWKATQGLPSPPLPEHTRSKETISAPKSISKSPVSNKLITKATPMSPSIPFSNAIDDDMDGFPEEPQEIEQESNTWESAARSEESSEIVRQLERGLPRWPGGHDKGWMEELPRGARRWHTLGSHTYGLCLLLQRLYQLLTSPPYPDSIPATSSNFSSITAGPGIARPIHSQTGESSHAVTMFRIPTKDRIFTDELIYKGWTVRMGDWVHLMNPDDPARPVIGQVFKTWVPDGEGVKTQQGLTVCWYFRPEQTYHSAQRQFWENEVFKTGHFADHVAEDIIEKIACQFTAKHIRGRPRPPYWYPGWPLYVCDSRYNDRERVFVKIKNWNSCIPEEFRKNDFMPIYPFERIIYPKFVQSPFLNGVKGPGQLTEGNPEKPELDRPNSDNTFRRRTRKSTQNTASVNATSGVNGDIQTNEPNPIVSAYPAPATGQTIAGSNQLKDRSIIAVAGTNPNITVEVLPPETVKHFDRDPETNQVLWFSGPPIDVARTPVPRHSLKYLHYLAMQKKRKAMDDDVVNGNMPTSDRVAKRRITDELNEIWSSVTKDKNQQ